MNNSIKALIPSRIRRVARSILEEMKTAQPKVATPWDVLYGAYKRIGIMNYENDEVSGELAFTKTILPILVSGPRPVAFDVGANVGDYSKLLLEVLPRAQIHAFEPSAETYNKLTGRLSTPRVTSVMKGLSSVPGKASFFDYSDRASAHASLHGSVLSELHHAAAVRSFEVALTTLDQYCDEQGIPGIDFIKIDTEGNELEVLRGGQKRIECGLLPLIQFEFNEMNVVSRSFLRDFYQLLKSYEFFRLMPSGLLPLGSYSPRHEIFAFQNILAVRKASYSSEVMRPFLVSALREPPVTNNR